MGINYGKYVTDLLKHNLDLQMNSYIYVYICMKIQFNLYFFTFTPLICIFAVKKLGGFHYKYINVRL